MHYGTVRITRNQEYIFPSRMVLHKLTEIN